MAKKEVSYHKYKDGTKFTRRVLIGLFACYLVLLFLRDFGYIEVYDFKVVKITQQQKVIEVQQVKIEALQKELNHYKSDSI